MADLQRKSYNLFDKNATDTSNGYEANSYLNANGESGAGVNHNISEYIDISGYSTLTISGGQISSYYINNSFYNTNKEKISWFPCTTMPITVNVPNNAKYIRITISKSHVDTIMLNSGSTAKPYEPYGWVHSLHKLCSATETIQSGDTIYANGSPISAYTIKGNTMQDGTPTPSNPIEVNGVGERTENLYNIATVVENTFIKANTTGSPLGSEISNSDWSCSDYIEVSPNTEYTVQYPVYVYAATAGLVFFTSKSVSSAIEGVTTGTQGSKTYTFTTPNNCNYVRFSWSNQNGNETTFVTGGTAKPYEPYGFKIPISTLQTINNYLGSIQSTRQINKIVFDGTETGWDKGTYAFYYTINDMCIRSQVICTHYEYYDGTSSSAPTNSISTASGVGTSIWIKTADHDTTTLDQWKAYLQAQYAAGTPVTVYYVLNTATTGTVNEPLMAIGTYADSISNAAAIPTTDGANSISVDTTVQPSEFSATWTGWHNASVKEYDGTDWQ